MGSFARVGPSFYLQDIQLRSIDLSHPTLSLDVQVSSSKARRARGTALAQTEDVVVGLGEGEDEAILASRMRNGTGTALSPHSRPPRQRAAPLSQIGRASCRERVYVLV